MTSGLWIVVILGGALLLRRAIGPVERPIGGCAVVLAVFLFLAAFTNGRPRHFSHSELLVAGAVALLIVSTARRRAPESSRTRSGPPPLPGSPPPIPRSGPPHLERPAVNVPHLLLALLLSPLVIFFWLLGSLADLIAIPFHIAIGTLELVLALGIVLLGGAPRTLHKRGTARYRRAFACLSSMGDRLLSAFGCGGLVDRRRKPSPRLEPASTRSSPIEHPAAYPFEDRYRIESHLAGGGSTARLFVVRRIERHRPVGDRLVLKYFDMGIGSRLEEVIRESRGMQVAKQMGIVLDHDLGPHHFYYVMPYYEGETLTRAAARMHRSLSSGDALPPEDQRICLGWMAELLRILDTYHRHGVIHKDVKPDNVIVTENGVRLVDLGLLTPLTSAMTLTTHGTEYFRDPEMVKLAVQRKRVKDVTAVRFDVYSAGAVLYYVLEGTFPACGPLSRITKPVPMVLSYIASHAMAEGAKRYPSAAAMRADVEAVIRASDAGTLDRMAVSELPSFRGDYAVEGTSTPSPSLHEEPFDRSQDVSSSWSPPVDAVWTPPPTLDPPEPLGPRTQERAGSPHRSGSRSSGFLAGAVALMVVLGLATMGLFLFGSVDAPIAIPMSDSPHSSRTARAERVALVDTVFSRWQETDALLEKAADGADRSRVPLLLVAEPRCRDIVLSARGELQRRGVPVLTSTRLASGARKILHEHLKKYQIENGLLRLLRGDPLPVVAWIRPRFGHGDGTPDGYDMKFYYRELPIDDARLSTRYSWTAGRRGHGAPRPTAVGDR